MEARSRGLIVARFPHGIQELISARRDMYLLHDRLLRNLIDGFQLQKLLEVLPPSEAQLQQGLSIFGVLGLGYWLYTQFVVLKKPLVSSRLARLWISALDFCLCLGARLCLGPTVDIILPRAKGFPFDID